MSWLAAFHIAEWVLRRRFVPVTALAWLTVIFFEPLVGAALYALVGDRRRDVVASMRLARIFHRPI